MSKKGAWRWDIRTLRPGTLVSADLARLCGDMFAWRGLIIAASYGHLAELHLLWRTLWPRFQIVNQERWQQGCCSGSPGKAWAM